MTSDGSMPVLSAGEVVERVGQIVAEGADADEIVATVLRYRPVPDQFAALFARARMVAGHPADDEDQSNDAILGRMFIAQRRELQLALSVPQGQADAGWEEPEEIAWMREVDAGTDNACFVVCAKGDPGGFAVYASPSPVPAGEGGGWQRLAELRSQGWAVAVHNDYRQGGDARTFWLFTHPDGRWLKGEGRTDAEAIAEASAPLAAEHSPPTPEQGPTLDGADQQIAALPQGDKP